MISLYTYEDVINGMAGNVSEEELDDALIECNRIASALGLGMNVESLITVPEEELEDNIPYISTPTDVGFKWVKELRMPTENVTASLFDNGEFKVVIQEVVDTKFYWFSNDGNAEEYINMLREVSGNF